MQNIREAVQQAVREKLAEAVQDMDFSDLINRIADGFIESEIGDVETEAGEYVASEVCDWSGKIGAVSTLHEILDEYMEG